MKMRQAYVCDAGDTFDMAALKLFGDEKYARELMAENLKHAATQIFSGGEQLLVPEVDRSEEGAQAFSKTAPWRA